MHVFLQCQCKHTWGGGRGGGVMCDPVRVSVVSVWHVKGDHNKLTVFTGQGESLKSETTRGLLNAIDAPIHVYMIHVVLTHYSKRVKIQPFQRGDWL